MTYDFRVLCLSFMVFCLILSWMDQYSLKFILKILLFLNLLYTFERKY